jgi:hypothetical protein
MPQVGDFCLHEIRQGLQSQLRLSPEAIEAALNKRPHCGSQYIHTNYE